MSAEDLRSAAALMRSRAEAATPGPWRRCFGFPAYVGGPGPTVTINDLSGDMEITDAEHVASWHPAVALAVADWLEFEANCTDRAAKQFPSQQWDADERALAVARAYLGDQS